MPTQSDMQRNGLAWPRLELAQKQLARKRAVERARVLPSYDAEDVEEITTRTAAVAADTAAAIVARISKPDSDAPHAKWHKLKAGATKAGAIIGALAAIAAAIAQLAGLFSR